MNTTLKTLKEAIDVHIRNFIAESVDKVIDLAVNDSTLRGRRELGWYNSLPYFQYRFYETNRDKLIGDMNIRFHLLEKPVLSTSLYGNNNKLKAIAQSIFAETEELLEEFDNR